MKRAIMRLLVLFASVGLAASCGGGGGKDKGFEFGGRWAARFVVTSSNVPANPVGEQSSDLIIITQSGNTVTVMLQSVNPYLVMNGPCDPDAKTFSATGIASGPLNGVKVDLNGNGLDDDSMSGTYSMRLSGAFTSGTWTADLSSRSATEPESASGTMMDQASGLSR